MKDSVIYLTILNFILLLIKLFMKSKYPFLIVIDLNTSSEYKIY